VAAPASILETSSGGVETNLFPALNDLPGQPYLRWYEWGDASITGAVTRPGRIGAEESRLTKILADAAHARSLKMPTEDRERLLIWLDGNVPFYGTYEKDPQRQQQAGVAVAPPEIQ
jgi:hypothetical protein